MIELKPAINEVKLTLKSISSPINLGTVVEPVSGGSVPTDVRQAIYTLLENAAYVTTGLEDEIAIVQAWAQEVTALSLEPTSLELNNDTPQSIIATTVPAGSTVLWSSSNESVATVVDGVVTGVSNGSCVITATAGNKTANCAVTVSGFATLESISAVYTQSGTVFETTPLDDLKADLVVTATYDDTSTATITAYTLSGELTAGTSTITVTYSGKTTTFDVNVTLSGWLYEFNDSLLSSGSKDFNFTGTANYTTGVDGNAYWHKVTTEGDNTTDVGAIKATGVTDLPDFTGDWTIAMWHKSLTDYRGHMLTATEYIQSGDTTNKFATPESVKSGWTVTMASGMSRTAGGIILDWESFALKVKIMGTSKTISAVYSITPPNSFSTLDWHHYALTRDDTAGYMYFFIDGELIFKANIIADILFGKNIAIGNLFGATSATQTTTTASSYGDIVDDLYIAERCKWTSDFDPSEITY